MSWDRILENDAGEVEPLARRIEELFAEQRESWPALREGEASLSQLRSKTLEHEGERVVVQVNPGRRRSTHAKTDTRSIATRPCFLCPQNMPAEERGVAFEELVVLPNPFPILPRHCTIAHRDHRPQELAGRVDLLLRLAAALGPDVAALYNGPRCGASAPDHFHFQAASAADVPILSQLPPVAESYYQAGIRSFERSILLFASSDASDVQAGVEDAMAALRHLEDADVEPMMNLIAYFHADRYVAVLFPRAAHRPSQYFAEGSEQLAVSPAVLEMAGLLVTTDPEHFERIDTTTALSIYEQVSLERERFESVVAELN